ncbi:hypothetical protein [Microbispora corallina]|nr:hypothetical protein [Microbispora corallina]
MSRIEAADDTVPDVQTYGDERRLPARARTGAGVMTGDGRR